MEYGAVRNLATMFFDRARRHPEAPFLWAKTGGVWTGQTYGEAREAVSRLSRGLRALGVGTGDRVALIAENQPAWAIADLAIMAAGAVTVPAYTTNTTADHAYILDHADAKLAIVSSPRLAGRALPAIGRSAHCRTVVALSPPEADVPDGVALHLWDDVLATGAALPDDVESKAAERTRRDLACFIYTSGTGGYPKGVMLSHGAILANCEGAYHLLLELGLDDEVFLSLLPLSHSYEHTAGLHFPISIGAQIYYCEGPDQLAGNLLEARPTIMTAVPRLYEVLHDRIRRGVERQGGLKAKLFGKAVALGRKAYEDPAGLTLGERLANRLLDLLVRRKVAARFGGRLKAFVSGGGALNPDIGKFFLALGVRILQGYGQTEAAPVVSCNPPRRIKIHKVGPPLKDVEVRIAEDGEILVRGELLMTGYWKEPELTAATIADGWLHTGDVGQVDADGYIEITDRKKDIVVLSGGDNVAPARVEGQLCFEPEIAQAMVYGDRHPHLVAVLVPAAEFVQDWARRTGGDGDLAALANDAGFCKALGAAVDRVNRRVSTLERVRRFVVAAEPFSIENGMMTPTLKVRRHKVKERYGETLEGLYDGR